MEAVLSVKVKHPEPEAWKSSEGDLVRIRIYLENGVRILFTAKLDTFPSDVDLRDLKRDLERYLKTGSLNLHISKFSKTVFEKVREHSGSCFYYTDKVNPSVRTAIIASENFRTMVKLAGNTKPSYQI